MTKVSRTFRIDRKLSKALDKITEYPITLTYHIEQALAQYEPIRAAIIAEKPKDG